MATGKEQRVIGQNLFPAGTLLVRVGNLNGAGLDVLQRLERQHTQMPTSFHRTLLETFKGEMAAATDSYRVRKQRSESRRVDIPDRRPMKGSP